MSEISDRTPVIIGVGQFSERPQDDGYQGLSHMDLGGRALGAAIADCAASEDVATAIDTLAAIPQFEISTPRAVAPFGKSDNPPRSFAKRVGADPKRAILEVVGGQGNQKLVGEFAADIAEGRSDVATIVGAEAMSTVLSLAKKGEQPDWSEDVGGQLEARGFGMEGLFDRTLRDNGLVGVIACYALFENRRRADKGLTLDQSRREIAELFAPFSEIAARNPHAAAPVERSIDELATVTERNRIVAEPYARMTVARDQVNQGAAIILASAAKARSLGVPEDRWIHIHAVTTAADSSILTRPNLASSETAIASVHKALEIAGVTMDEIAYLDIYSCFAIPVFNIIEAFGVAPDDPRGLTLTGGLPFFGGAGNNYSAHAIAEAVQRLRKDRSAFALVNANGGAMHKNAVGIYSAQPADWGGIERYQAVPRQQDEVEVIDQYDGEAIVETFTLASGPAGPFGAVVARSREGERLAAMTAPNDHDTLSELAKGEPFGRRISVLHVGDRRHHFTFA